MKRLLAFFRKRQMDAAMADEIRDHLESLEQDFLRAGMTPAEARLEARRHFGGVARTEEACRDQRGIRIFDALTQDLRYSFRTLARTPAFSAIAILTLALGIGVNTAVFSVVNAVVLRPLPYPDPATLVALNETEGHSRGAVSPANLADYQRMNRSFISLAGYHLQGMNLTEAGTPERLFVQRGTANFFSTIGVQPALGRDFTPEEDVSGKHRTVILSHELWQSRFSADPGILGRSIRLDGQLHQVVGIMPHGFVPPLQFGLPNPISLYMPAAYPAELLANHDYHEISALGRLKPGVTLQQAQADLDGITNWLAATYPKTNAEVRAILSPLDADLVRGVRLALLVLLGAVGLVWLVACVNVANLLLARAVGQRREIAVRVALGAGRARVIGSLVVFSTVLAGLGCGAGLLLGAAVTRLLVRLAPATIPRLNLVAVDGSVLGVMCGLSLVSGIVFGLVPAWQVSRSNPGDALKSSERGLTSAVMLRWRSAFALAEIALSLILLIGGGLLLRSFLLLNAVDLGFQSNQVLALSLNLPQGRYPDAQNRLAFFEELESRVRCIPGVIAAGAANRLPMRGGWGGGIQVDSPGAPGGLIETKTDLQAVTPGYFATLGIPVSRGRLFTAADRSGQPYVAMVNATFVRQLFGEQDPLGQRFRRHAKAPWVTIIGVVGDVRRDGKSQPVRPEVYFPATQVETYPVPLADFAVRAAGDPRQLTAAIQDAVWSIDKDQPLTNVKTLDQVVSDSVAQRRFQTLLLILFAAVAVVLAIIGIYGVISYSVSQRTAEIGLRVAMGARPKDVVSRVMRQAALLILGGITLGIAGAYALSRYIASLLFAISAADPSTYLYVSLLLAIVAFAACLAPARRAASLDPLAALRCD